MVCKTNVGQPHWVKSLIGQPHWFGTCSYKATESLLKRKAEQYPSHYAESRMNRYRQDIRNGATVQDCVGIIKGYYWTRDDGTQKYGLDGRPDKGANGMHMAATIKGAIATIPEIIGLIVHLGGHAGVYIRDGWVIEARGFNYGVVLTRLKDRPWTSWFKCPYIEYIDDAAYEDSPLGNESVSHDLLHTLSYIDDIYDPKMEAAVCTFQKSAGIQVDGIVGSEMLAHLFGGQ